MNENQPNNQNNTPEPDEKGKNWMNLPIMNFRDNSKKSIFKVFGIEMIAPSSLGNPRLIYLAFILVNISIFVLIRNLVLSNQPS